MSIPYFPLYVSDYDADTAHLTLEEDGAYLRLLRLCWRTPGCSIPADDAWIMRRMRVTAEDFERVVKPVLSEFFQCEKARLFSPRLTAESQRISDTQKKRSQAGKKGGRPVKSLKNNETTKRRAKAKQKQPEPEPEPESEEEITRILREVFSDQIAADFIDHRRDLKKPLTPRAAKAIATKLRGNPNADQIAIDSIANGWQGVFPKEVKNETTSKQDDRMRAFLEGARDTS